MANSSSRAGARVIWVTVHTAEGITKASDLKAFFERSTNSSAHAVADDSTLLDNLVPYDRAAWTLRNGNSKSDNLELCGFARWSREDWLNHPGMLNNAAAWIRSRCLARGIPIRHLSVADVAAGRAGVIGHVDYTNATGDGTHWDPGPGFPWDIVIAKAAGETRPAEEKDDDMAVMGKVTDDDYIVVPCNGKTGLFLGVAYGRKVRVLEVWAIRDTPAGSGASTEYVTGAMDWAADRPGPKALPAGTRSVTVRYKADHEFTAWCD